MLAAAGAVLLAASPNAAAQEGGTPKPTVAVARASPSLPRLAGVLVQPGVRQAMFGGVGADTLVVVGEGERIGAFTVREIKPGEVQVSDAAAIYTLRPSSNAGFRTGLIRTRPLTPFIDPIRREMEMENDQ